MAATAHHTIHLPPSVPSAVHIVERVVGAIFFTILAPVSFAIFILAGLVLALGLAKLL
ncbi:MAG TPA: hypothetical protein VLA09_03725 [Longimicrobiales bacterium]|nr:hypothetical protein [Longimicrobiales bacterium]